MKLFQQLGQFLALPNTLDVYVFLHFLLQRVVKEKSLSFLLPRENVRLSICLYLKVILMYF